MLIKTAIAGAVLASLAFAAPAHADPLEQVAVALCADLYANPTDSQVYSEFQALSRGWGYTTDQSAEFIVNSVTRYCPSNMYVLRHFGANSTRQSGQVL